MQLDPQKHAFLTDPAILRIFDALPSGSTQFVGGAVRNAILGEPVADIDMATTCRPDAVETSLKAADISTHPTGIAHGTITAISNNRIVEITTLRKDVSTDGRRATVAFTEDWFEDATRRDFTMNALYADRHGTVTDPTGLGLDDAQARRVRFVGEAAARVAEDHLRILRYFRFCAWYAPREKMDAQALSACRNARKDIKSLSSERIWMEYKKLLRAPNPGRIAHVMLSQKILDVIAPEASNVEGLQAFISLEQREGLKPDPLRRIMAMSGRDEFALAGFAKRMKLSNAEKSRLLGWAGDRTIFDPNAADKEKRIAIYSAGRETAQDRCLIRAAGETDPVQSTRWMSLFDLALGWTFPEFPITGKDLKAAGVNEGPDMGKAMKALKALWIRSGFEADKPRLLQALKLFGLGD